jgi:hypothetical protein
MDIARFDHLTRTVSTLLSRRTLAGTLGLGALALPGLAEAKKHKKRKKKKIKLNDFGCVNVGGFCKNSGQCCSGICSGKKGKKKCKAHNASTCTAADDFCLAGVATPCTLEGGGVGQCVRTTGEASYCEADGGCVDCTKDADCVPFCGAGAACIVCPIECGPNGTACVGASPGACTIPI